MVVRGPFPDAVGSPSLYTSNSGRVLLLLAGGVGITTWLPYLRHVGAQTQCHLVWCVRKREDYLALVHMLPSATTAPHVQVTVCITRSTADTSLAPAPQAAIDDTTQCQNSVQAGKLRFAAAPLVSLAATLAGTSVAYCCWKIKMTHGMDILDGMSMATLSGYVLVLRVLPILLISVSMYVTMILARCIFHRATIDRCNRCNRGPESDQLIPSALHPRADLALVISEHAPDEPAHQHQMRSGRPDLNELIQNATSMLQRKQMLVVGARGPPSLIKAARSAVESTKLTGFCNRHDKYVKFAGAESNW